MNSSLTNRMQLASCEHLKARCKQHHQKKSIEQPPSKKAASKAHTKLIERNKGIPRCTQGIMLPGFFLWKRLQHARPSFVGPLPFWSTRMLQCFQALKLLSMQQTISSPFHVFSGGDQCESHIGAKFAVHSETIFTIIIQIILIDRNGQQQRE